MNKSRDSWLRFFTAPVVIDIAPCVKKTTRSVDIRGNVTAYNTLNIHPSSIKGSQILVVARIP